MHCNSESMRVEPLSGKQDVVIGVTTYMFGEFLEECLQSLVNQTLRPMQIVVCDDCSTDMSWGIMTQFKSEYPDLFSIHRPEGNVGPSHICDYLEDRMPPADYYTLIDGDDRWHPRKLEMEVRAIHRHNADVAYSDVTLINQVGKPYGEWRKLDSIPDAGHLFTNVYGKRFFKNSTSVFRNEMVSYKAFKSIGGYDYKLQNFWDWDLKVRLAHNYTIAFSGEKLVDYRQHPRGISKTTDARNLLGAHLQVYEKHLQLLAQYSLLEQVRVHLSFEVAQVRRRVNLNTKDYPEYDLASVRKRLVPLLDRLEPTELIQLRNGFAPELAVLGFEL